MNMYQKFLSEVNNSNTLRGYAYTIQSFEGACPIDPIHDDFVTVREGIKTWLWESNWKDSTSRVRLAGIQAFFSWLEREGYRKDNPSHRITIKREQKEDLIPEFPSIESADKVVEYMALSKYDNDSCMRNYLIVAMLKQGGFRISELLALRRDDIEPSGKVFIRRAKRNKWRVTGVRPDLAQEVLSYAKSDPVFDITDRWVNYMLKEAVTQVGLPEWECDLLGHPHGWRHVWASMHVQAGTDLTQLMLQAGWSSPKMLDVYVMKNSMTPVAL